MITRRLIPISAFLALAFLPGINAFAQHSRLTPELLSKISAAAQKEGYDRDIPPLLASYLGMPPGEDWPTRQFNSKDANGNYHAVGINRRSDQDIALVVLFPNINLHAFRVHRDGTLVAGAIRDLKTEQYTKLSLDIAQKELENEFAYWKRVFDTPK